MKVVLLPNSHSFRADSPPSHPRHAVDPRTQRLAALEQDGDIQWAERGRTGEEVVVAGEQLDGPEAKCGWGGVGRGRTCGRVGTWRRNGEREDGGGHAGVCAWADGRGRRLGEIRLGGVPSTLYHT